ncbi:MULTISPECIES: short-chain fatty acid transporter [unclassified Halomonas]|uniref:short-chain fatty acid transporter n=1 Tax=unclassified Halomonas TaxID=2609666 RepID=UPI00099055E0|nr:MULTISPECIES: TIGR00366 family protein [unclassified Halomonas]AQU82175.1 short-chain fatty acid transporter [Halomonas sp. 'Soap Lake \
MSNNTLKISKKNKLFGCVTNGLTRIFDRYLPDPLVIVIVLTIVIMLACVVFRGDAPTNMLGYWMDGFWSLHGFAMQMVLILVAGFVVATTPLFKFLTLRIADSARTPGKAIVIVTVVSLLASWLNWGIGLVVGAVLAKELAKRVPFVDYRLLIASAYSGFLIWHAGLSGSIPLSLATSGHFLEGSVGLIPTSETLFSPLNIGLILAMFIALPLTNYLMMKSSESVPFTDFADEPPIKADVSRPAERLEHSIWPALLISLLGIAALIFYAVNGGGLNLNVIIFALIFIGIGLHKNLSSFLEQINEAVKGASGIIIQFPFYAGLMGIMAQSGLAGDLAQVFVDISTADTLPVWSFLSAGLINMLVPSGGGQWAVQGPIVMEAAQALNADTSRVAMAFAWGDSWTNMLQPFWALPALAIAGLKARDIMGYCAVVLVVSGVIISLALLLF